MRGPVFNFIARRGKCQSPNASIAAPAIIVFLLVVLAGCDDKTGDTAQQILKCAQIKNFDERQECYRVLSTGHKDITLCDKGQSAEYIYTCYTSVAGESLDPKVCALVRQKEQAVYSPNTLSNECYKKQAIRLSDESLCKEMSSSSEQEAMDRDNCLIAVAAKKQDKNICGKIINPSNRQACNTRITDGQADL